MNNFDIPQAEAEKIFREMIVPQTMQGVSPSKKKQGYVLGGQPGSGKSASVRELLKSNKNVVFINGDDLRAYHPKYNFYLKNNDVEAADMTQAVCNFWIESLIDECTKQSMDLIVEGTMRRKEVPKITGEKLLSAGYKVNLVVISTPYEVSIRSMHYRYEELKKLGLPARFTKKQSHDEAYKNIESTLQDLLDSKLFDKFYVYKRLDGSFEGGVFGIENKDQALLLFRSGRNRAVEDEEKHKHFISETTFKPPIS